MPSGELRSLTANLRFKSVREGLDKLEDVGLGTRFLNLLLGDFRFGLDGAEKDVEADGARIEGRLLRHERQLLTERLDVEIAERNAVERNGARERVIESLGELDSR